MRALLGLALLLGVVGPTTAANSAPAGQVVVTATGNARAVVSLPRGVLHPVDSPDLRVAVSGPGRFLGAVLLPHGKPFAADLPSLVIGAVGLPGRPNPTVVLGGGTGPVLPARLPPGTYDLHVAATGQVRLTLSLPGARTQVLHATPSGAVRHRSDSASAVPGQVAAPAFSAGEDVVAGPSGLYGVALVWWSGPAQAQRSSGVCLYPGGAPNAQVYRVPGVCGAQGGRVLGLVDARAPADTLSFAWVHLSPGRWGMKTDYVVGGALTDAGISTLLVTG